MKPLRIHADHPIVVFTLFFSLYSIYLFFHQPIGIYSADVIRSVDEMSGPATAGMGFLRTSQSFYYFFVRIMFVVFGTLSPYVIIKVILMSAAGAYCYLLVLGRFSNRTLAGVVTLLTLFLPLNIGIVLWLHKTSLFAILVLLDLLFLFELSSRSLLSRRKSILFFVVQFSLMAVRLDGLVIGIFSLGCYIYANSTRLKPALWSALVIFGAGICHVWISYDPSDSRQSIGFSRVLTKLYSVDADVFGEEDFGYLEGIVEKGRLQTWLDAVEMSPPLCTTAIVKFHEDQTIRLRRLNPEEKINFYFWSIRKIFFNFHSYLLIQTKTLWTAALCHYDNFVQNDFRKRYHGLKLTRYGSTMSQTPEHRIFLARPNLDRPFSLRSTLSWMWHFFAQSFLISLVGGFVFQFVSLCRFKKPLLFLIPINAYSIFLLFAYTYVHKVYYFNYMVLSGTFVIFVSTALLVRNWKTAEGPVSDDGPEHT